MSVSPYSESSQYINHSCLLSNCVCVRNEGKQHSYALSLFSSSWCRRTKFAVDWCAYSRSMFRWKRLKFIYRKRKPLNIFGSNRPNGDDSISDGEFKYMKNWKNDLKEISWIIIPLSIYSNDFSLEAFNFRNKHILAFPYYANFKLKAAMSFDRILTHSRLL